MKAKVERVPGTVVVSVDLGGGVLASGCERAASKDELAVVVLEVGSEGGSVHHSVGREIVQIILSSHTNMGSIKRECLSIVVSS